MWNDCIRLNVPLNMAKIDHGISSSSQPSIVYDCIVVGAGIEGSATAYQLAKNDYSTLLLEQFPLPHTRGSSHGQSRITRRAYNKRIYADMMKEAYPMWHQLERETNNTLYRQTELLYLQKAPCKGLKLRLNSLRDLRLPFTKLSNTTINRRYPIVHYGDDYQGVIDHEAGVLMADKCLHSYQKQFIKFGGKLRDGEKVIKINPGIVVTVTTKKSQYRARSVVLATGPWSGEILKTLGLHPPLTTWRINVCYWKEKKPGTIKNFPILIELASDDEYILPGHKIPEQAGILYGLPCIEYPGMIKLSYHCGNKEVLPDDRDKFARGDQEEIKILQRCIRNHFPGLEDEPAIIEYCMYTNTPDENPILDRHPVYPNIVIGCGMSGHGFKLAPVVGKVLCELAMGLPQSYDLEIFSLKRFDKLSSKL